MKRQHGEHGERLAAKLGFCDQVELQWWIKEVPQWKGRKMFKPIPDLAIWIVLSLSLCTFPVLRAALVGPVPWSLWWFYFLGWCLTFSVGLFSWLMITSILFAVFLSFSGSSSNSSCVVIALLVSLVRSHSTSTWFWVSSSF